MEIIIYFCKNNIYQYPFIGYITFPASTPRKK
uniref:Uncharacterized protein n=1 Tax=Anguilla anguilla TaxID=7936 RepID=A0A0E9UND5_ANGAN